MDSAGYLSPPPGRRGYRGPGRPRRATGDLQPGPEVIMWTQPHDHGSGRGAAALAARPAGRARAIRPRAAARPGREEAGSAPSDEPAGPGRALVTVPCRDWGRRESGRRAAG